MKQQKQDTKLKETKEEIKEIPIIEQEAKPSVLVVKEPSRFPTIDVEIMKRLERLENGYQLIIDYKGKLDNLLSQSEKKEEKLHKIEELENNIMAVFQSISALFEIEVNGVPINEGIEQMESWLGEQPVPNFKNAAYNGYHYAIEIKKRGMEFDKLKQNLTLLFNTWKTEVRG
jgi:hypothetical protein